MFGMKGQVAKRAFSQRNQVCIMMTSAFFQVMVDHQVTRILFIFRRVQLRIFLNVKKAVYGLRLIAAEHVEEKQNHPQRRLEGGFCISFKSVLLRLHKAYPSILNRQR